MFSLTFECDLPKLSTRRMYLLKTIAEFNALTLDFQSRQLKLPKFSKRINELAILHDLLTTRAADCE